MKIKLRNLMLLMLVITVFVPIVLLSNSIGVYFPSSARNELIEDASTFAFAGEIRPLKVLHHESSTKLRESQDDFYSNNLIDSASNNTDALSGGSTGIIRQLTEDDITVNSSTTTNDVGNNLQKDEKPLILEMHTMPENREKSTDPKVNMSISVGGDQGDINALQFKGTSKIAKETMNDESRKQNDAAAIPDARIRQIKDRITEGKLYLSLLATQNNPSFIRSLRIHLKEATEALGGATTDSKLPRDVHEKVKALERSLVKAKQIQEDCGSANTKKLHTTLVSYEEQLRSSQKQVLYLSQLAAKTIPKGLHCLSLRLSTEYFMLGSSQRHFHNKGKVDDDPKLFHYALFSDNILATAVVVNSTITHAKDPSKHVFHVVTDGLNFAPMKMWFLSNPPGEATVHVANVEDFTWLNASYSPVLKQLTTQKMIDYYYRSHQAQSDPNAKYRNPKYLSIMNHLRFYLPEIFPELDKILFLDDDIVVQKDLTPLWSLDLKNKVIGVVETCGERFHRFDHYLNFSNPLILKSFDPHACGWAFGMNIFDLREWRKQNITQIYHKWQALNQDRLLWKLGTLPPGLITFWNRSFSLEKSWHVLGLGYNPKVPQKYIERAAVIHYNGNLKPWLEIAIPKFKNYWTKYVDFEQRYLQECNITP